jgi:hypothetical protein
MCLAGVAPTCSGHALRSAGQWPKSLNCIELIEIVGLGKCHEHDEPRRSNDTAASRSPRAEPAERPGSAGGGGPDRLDRGTRPPERASPFSPEQPSAR